MLHFSHIDKNASDESLLMKLKNGNQKAFIHIYNRYHKVLYVVAYKYLKETEQAKDCVQDVFLKLWEEKAEIQIQSSLKNYLYAMTRNHILNTVKKNNRQIVSNYEKEQETLADSDNLFEIIAQKELTETLYTAIETLPEQKKKICLLKMEGRFTNKEIAEQLQITENTVKKHYTQTLMLLRVILKKILICFFFVTPM